MEVGLILELALAFFDKKVLLGVSLTGVPWLIYIYVNNTFVKRNKIVILNNDLNDINQEIIKLKEQIKLIEKEKISVNDLTTFMESFRDEFKSIERKLTKVLGTVIGMLKTDGGTTSEDIIKLIDES